jgi:hypothetical protein
MQDIRRIRLRAHLPVWIVPQGYIKGRTRSIQTKKTIKTILSKTETLLTQLENGGFEGMSSVATYIILREIKDLVGTLEGGKK